MRTVPHDRYPVKPFRRSLRPAAPFGEGIDSPAGCTPEDAVTAVRAFADQREQEQERAVAAAFAERMAQGWRF